MQAKIYFISMKPYNSVLAETSRSLGVTIFIYSIVSTSFGMQTFAKCYPSNRKISCSNIIDYLRKNEKVLELELLEKNISSCSFLITKRKCEFYEYTLASARHIIFPYIIEQGYRKFYLIAIDNKQSLAKQLSRFGEVILLNKVPPSKAFAELNKMVVKEEIFSVLTPVQKQVLLEATRKGYFSYPRKISLEKLSGELHKTKATVYEHLRAAELRLLDYIFS